MKKISKKKLLIFLRDILTIFIGYSLTDLIVLHWGISSKYEIFIYLGILLVITIIGMSTERFIRKNLKKKL